MVWSPAERDGSITPPQRRVSRGPLGDTCRGSRALGGSGQLSSARDAREFGLGISPRKYNAQRTYYKAGGSTPLHVSLLNDTRLI